MRQALERQISEQIDRKRRAVFLRADFADLGGYDQVGRALRQFVRGRSADENRIGSVRPRTTLHA